MKHTKKIVATILASMLMSMNLLSMGSEVIAVAEELANQNEKTNHANIEFNTHFEDGSYQKEFEIGKEASLTINLQVKNSGYLRNGIVEFSGGNYKIDSANLQNENVQSASENQIKLKQIESNDGKIAIQVPILLNEQETASIDYLSKQTEVKFTASYIDSNGKEKQIEKSIINQAIWTLKPELEVNNEVTKFTPYKIDENYGVMLQAKVTSKIKDNTIPVKNTQISINAPIFSIEKQTDQQAKQGTEQQEEEQNVTKVQEVHLSKVTVIANSTKATNGKTSGIEFTENNYTYDAENNQVIIQVQNQEENGKIAWAKQAQDEYIITFIYKGKEIYDTVTTNLNSIQKISGNLNTTVKCKLYDKAQSEIEKTVQTAYTLEEKSENLNDYGINYTNELSKGYFYANQVKNEKEASGEEIEEKQETIYQIIYRAKIVDKELVDNISFTSQPESFEGQAKYAVNSYTKTILIPENIFHKMLGEEGKVEIFKSDDTKIGEITKETPKDEKGNYLLDISNQDANEICIKTSKPVTEGEFALKLTKALKTEQTITKVQMQNITKMTIGVTASSNDEKSLEGEIYLVEPITKAELIIEEGKQNLSTVIENKDVEIKVILDTSSTKYALYKNPKFEIELPSYIEKVTLKDVTLLLDEELKIKDKQVTNKNGRQVIMITLEGTQSEYFNSNMQAEESQNIITKGANIIIRADMLVKKLTPSKTENINLYYTNENTDLYEEVYTEPTTNNNAKKVVARTISTATSEIKGIATTSITFVAPTGVTAATTITGYDTSGNELDNTTNEKKEANIPVYESAQTITVTGTIMNNYENSIGNIAILGRIPYQGNKKIDTSEELGSTFTTKLLTDISFTGMDSSKVNIYYSENGEATKDLQNSQNGWKDELVNLATVKSYLIIISPTEELAQTAQISFQYKAELPANLPYNQSTYSVYKVYYNSNTNGTTIGETKTSGIVGLTTGQGPDLEIKLTSLIEENEVVRHGQYVRFFVEVTNKGTIPAKNAKIVIDGNTEPKETINEEGETVYHDTTPYYIVNYDELLGSFEEIEENKKIIELNDIGVNETKKAEYEVEIRCLEEQLDILNQVIVIADNMEKEQKSNEYILKAKAGVLQITNRTNTLEATRYLQNTEVEYDIRVNTIGIEEGVSNIIVTIPLPKDITVTEAYMKTIGGNSTEGIQILSDKILVTINQLNASANQDIHVTFQLGEQTEQEFSTKIEASLGEDTYYSNERFIHMGYNHIEGSQMALEKTYIKEREKFCYEFIINTSGTVEIKNFVLEDTLPEEISLIDGYLEEKGGVQITIEKGIEKTLNEVTIIDGNKLSIKIPSIDPNVTLKIRIYVEGSLKEKVDEKEVSNSAVIYAENIDKINLNTVKHYLEYVPETHGEGSLHPNDPNNPDNPNQPGQEKRYKITGLAWIDENKNGMNDEEEQILPEMKVLLIYKTNSQIVKDVDTGEEKIATTDSEGKYEFSNLQPNEYLVVFLYDAGKYNITEYQKEGASQSNNSDAINMKITLYGEKTYAGVSNTIRIINDNIRNIDIGLYVAEKFDLRLDKYISKITLTTPTIGTKVYTYEKSQLEKIEILNKNVGKSNIIVEYKIVVTNEGQVPGYARKIIDYLPLDTKFNTELNPKWYVSDNNRTVYNTELAETKLQPGESKEVSLILSLNITEKNIGTIINNNAEIYESYNEQGVEDIDSTTANKLENEDDMSKADIVLSIVTGKIIFYIILSLFMFTMIAISIIVIQKKVLKHEN